MNQAMTDPLILSEEDIESGGKEQRTSGIQNEFQYHNNVHNAAIKIRMGILFISLIFNLLL